MKTLFACLLAVIGTLAFSRLHDPDIEHIEQNAYLRGQLQSSAETYDSPELFCPVYHGLVDRVPAGFIELREPFNMPALEKACAADASIAVQVGPDDPAGREKLQ